MENQKIEKVSDVNTKEEFYTLYAGLRTYVEILTGEKTYKHPMLDALEKKNPILFKECHEQYEKEFMTNCFYKIQKEIYTAIQILGGKSDILSIIGSWGDTLSNDEIYTHLRSWNKIELELRKDSYCPTSYEYLAKRLED